MLYLVITLFIISLICLVIGAIWLLVKPGISARDQTEPLDRDLSSRDNEIDDLDGASEKIGEILPADRSNSSATMEEVRQGNWSSAGPLLLAVGGFLGLLLFGSFIVLILIEDKIIGALMVAIAAAAVLRVSIALARSNR